eukprot:7381753-Alexandrium_andersonii.AAC.1
MVSQASPPAPAASGRRAHVQGRRTARDGRRCEYICWAESWSGRNETGRLDAGVRVGERGE